MGRNIHTTHPLSNRAHWGYPFWKHAYHPHTAHTVSCYLLLPQTCIESGLYKLNALALITQKLYLKDSTHFKKNNATAMSWYYPHTSGDSAQNFIQSIPKINMEVASGLLTCLGLFLEGTPPPLSSAKKRNISGIHHDILCGKVTNLTWQDGVSALREVLRTWSHWMESDRWVNIQRKGSPVFLPQLSLHGWSRASSSGSHMNM